MRVKLGMLYDGLRARVVIDAVRQYAGDNIVGDPVLISTSGTPLLDQDGLQVLASALALSTLLTPNVPEVVAMTGKSVARKSDPIEAGHALPDLGARAVPLKGGHPHGDKCKDVLLRKGSLSQLISPLAACILAMTKGGFASFPRKSIRKAASSAWPISRASPTANWTEGRPLGSKQRIRCLAVPDVTRQFPETFS